MISQSNHSHNVRKLAVLLIVGGIAAHAQQRTAVVSPITSGSTEDEIRRAVGTARVGKKLTPKVWPNGARVAVCLTFDLDNELLQRANPLPVPLSVESMAPPPACREFWTSWTDIRSPQPSSSQP